MNISTIAFLVLLGGTPEEHVILLDGMDECHRAAESITQYSCMNADEYDAHLRSGGHTRSAFQTASGPLGRATPEQSAPARTVDKAASEEALVAMPSAVQRRVMDALYPGAARAPIQRVTPDGNSEP